MYVFNVAIFIQVKVENILGLDQLQWPQQATQVTEILLGHWELLTNIRVNMLLVVSASLFGVFTHWNKWDFYFCTAQQKTL